MRKSALIAAGFTLVATIFIFTLSTHFNSSHSSSHQSQKPQKQFAVPLLKNAEKINSNCSAHTELYNVDFLHDDLRSRLCDGTPAFTLVNGKFPPCKLSWDIPLTHLISPVDAKLPKLLTNLSQLTIYAHKGEWVTGLLNKAGGFEDLNVQQLISLVKAVGIDRTTFLDIGCNVGVYSVQARALGIKTVCVDGNIRNLLRLIMSAKRLKFENDEKFQIYWTFFNARVGIEHFRYESNVCHVGSGAPFLPKSVSVDDPIPVASSRGDDLIGRIPSSHVVIKIDIESFEPVFFDSARNFFDVYRVAAVLMEIYRNPYQPKLEISFLEDFFFSRKFKLFTVSLQEGNLRNWKGTNDALWVHQDFVPLLKNLPKL
jgi:FkbM family methyltransferase